MPKKSGFTLIELLVVVAIISILSLIGIAMYTSTLKSARDAKRKEDILAFAKALEVHKSGSTYNFTIDGSFFSGGKIPSDSRDSSQPQYCKIEGSTTIAIADPSNWVDTNPCPQNWSVLDPNGNNSLTNTLFWKICAKLESSTADSGTGLQIYCKESTR